MVVDFMTNLRSIMLIVTCAGVDIVTQDIVHMARKADKEGIRTIEVLAKLYVASRRSEKAFIDLIGRSHTLNLGWHMIRYPNQYELEKDRDWDAIEKQYFYMAKEWKDIDKGRLGIELVSRRVQTVTSYQIKATFPDVKAEFDIS